MIQFLLALLRTGKDAIALTHLHNHHALTHYACQALFCFSCGNLLGVASTAPLPLANQASLACRSVGSDSSGRESMTFCADR